MTIDIAAPNKPRIHLDLPEKMSALLRVGLDDLEKVEKSPHYEIDMGEWHRPQAKRDKAGERVGVVCAVCLAGAVMARALDETVLYHAGLFDSETTNKFDALDMLRTGSVVQAYMLLTDEEDANEESPAVRDIISRGLNSRHITRYNDSPELFRSQLRQLADDLEAAGL